MNKLISYFFLLSFFLMLPLLGNAVVDIKPILAPNQVEKTSTSSDILKLDEQKMQKKVKRKLKLKERIILRFVKRKLKRQAKNKPSKNRLESNARVGFGISIAGLILALLAFATTNLGLVLFSFICAISGLTFSLVILEKYKDSGIEPPGKGLAVAGVVIGLLVGGFWGVTFGFIFIEELFL